MKFPSIPTQPTLLNLTPAETIATQYNTCIAIISEYVDFMVARHYSKPTIVENVSDCTSHLVEKYHFGSAFVDEVELYTVNKFRSNLEDLQSRVDDKSGQSGSFDAVVSDLAKSNLLNLFDPAFRSALE